MPPSFSIIQRLPDVNFASVVIPHSRLTEMLGHIKRLYGIPQIPQNIPQENAEPPILIFSSVLMIFSSMVAGIFIFLWVVSSMITIILTHTVITGIFWITFWLRISRCRGGFLIDCRRRWNHNVTVCVCLKHCAIVQLWLFQWLFWLFLLHLNFFRILFFFFWLDLYWVFLNLNLLLELLLFLLNILKAMARSQLSSRKASTSALARGHVSPGHLSKQN
jgi:hypothetical protein